MFKLVGEEMRRDGIRERLGNRSRHTLASRFGLGVYGELRATWHNRPTPTS